MTGKTWILICVLVLLGGLLHAPAPTVARELTSPVPGFSRVAGFTTVGQMQFASPTSQPVEAYETSGPIASEAGRDYGLIIGAVILVAIVVGGMVFSARQQAARKARD